MSNVATIGILVYCARFSTQATCRFFILSRKIEAWQERQESFSLFYDLSLTL